jgi:hypothetical protein
VTTICPQKNRLSLACTSTRNPIPPPPPPPPPPPQPRTMPLAFLRFGKLSSSTKTITRFRNLSLKLQLRGMICTGKPAYIVISAPFEHADRLRRYIAQVKATGDRSVSLYHGHVDMTLGIDFEKKNGIKKIKDFRAIIDAAQANGYGGDVVGWIRAGEHRRVGLFELNKGFDLERRPLVAKKAREREREREAETETETGKESPPPQGRIVWGKDGPVNTGTIKRGLVTKYFV